MQEILRRLPGVDQVLEEDSVKTLLAVIPRSLVLKAIRETLEDLRQAVRQGRIPADSPDLTTTVICRRVGDKARDLTQPNFRRVVNATGVIIHTNLGRSPLAEEAVAAVLDAGRHYSNLEFDLAEGHRGIRYSHVEDLLCELTGAEAGLVVNNNAAAVLLTLGTLARNREAVVSRGELVEIGGSFRIPDVMAQSGAVMREVGATNKTHLRDYKRAINEQTALLLKVHQSNFQMTGFTSQVPVADLVALGNEHGLPVVEDLGSGSLIDFSIYGLRREPTVPETVAAGVAVVTFSGDKLLGGPQAGIILGTRDYIEQIKTNPLNRAMRIDKFTLASLEATLRLYLDPAAVLSRIPILSMITQPYRKIAGRAARLKRKLADIAGGRAVFELTDGLSQIGGGALPAQGLKTRLLTMTSPVLSPNSLEKWFRSRPVPIIGRIENERFIVDVRTMNGQDEKILIEAMKDLINGITA